MAVDLCQGLNTGYRFPAHDAYFWLYYKLRVHHANWPQVYVFLFHIHSNTTAARPLPFERASSNLRIDSPQSKALLRTVVVCGVFIIIVRVCVVGIFIKCHMWALAKNGPHAKREGKSQIHNHKPPCINHNLTPHSPFASFNYSPPLPSITNNQ